MVWFNQKNFHRRKNVEFTDRTTAITFEISQVIPVGGTSIAIDLTQILTDIERFTQGYFS